MTKTSPYFMLIATLLVAGNLQAQDTPQTPPKEAKTEPVKPEPKALPPLTVSAGVPFFRADCISVTPSGNDYVLTVTPGSLCVPATAKPENIKSLVVNYVTPTSELKTLLLDADKNFHDVQGGAIDGLLLVLGDQSIKVDNIKDLINAAAAQITADVLQRMERSVKAEVDRRLKEARPPARQ